jgi:NAD(P)H-nitrite reductase large subunit
MGNKNFDKMHIVIIGNGIAGSTAARFIRKWSDYDITMISNEGMYPFSRTALMYIYMGHMRAEHTKLYEDEFWQKNRINLVQDEVTDINLEQKKVILSNHDISYDKLIIASGSKSNKFGWPGQDLDGVRGLYHMGDLQYLEERSSKINHAVIVGGGLIGIRHHVGARKEFLGQCTAPRRITYDQ